MAIAAFRDEDKSPLPVSAIVRADLQRSGLFRIVDAPGSFDEGSRIAVADWRGRGADALAVGSVSRLADGRFDVRFKLWDLVKGEELVGQSHAALPADMRLAAHRVADSIYQNLTGERGVFATRIAYVTRAGSRYTLHVTDADGEGGQIALASPDPIISPAWSPDGKELAYVSFESQKAVVWVQDVSSGQRRMLANFRGSNSAPAWSPDGRDLALTLSRDAVAQLYLMSRDGGTPRRLTTSSSIDTEPVFTPDGRQIYFVSDRGGGPQVYRMPASWRQCRARHLQRQLQHQPRDQPRRTRAGLHHAPGRRLQGDGAGAGRRHADGHHRHCRRRKPQLRAQRQATGLCQPGRWPRRADDQHARRQDQEPPADHGRRHARTGLGPFWPLTLRPHSPTGESR